VVAAWVDHMRARLARHLAHGVGQEPLLVAGALIADADGRMLLIHRKTDEMTWWEVPGGKVEAGEVPWQAAQRELGEELNVTVEMVAEVGTERFDQGELALQYTWYVARVNAGIPTLVERDRFDDLRYFTWDELSALPDASPSVRCLRDRRAERVRQVLPVPRTAIAR